MYSKVAAVKAKKTSQIEDTCDVPPIAIYHICRVCLRPRSARYHREHPIPLGGLPPPPSDICSRCRIRPADERITVVDVSEEGRSNNIRIGVASLVPEDDYISNEEVQRRRAYRLLDDHGWKELEPSHSSRSPESSARSSVVSDVPPAIRSQDDVFYRHVRTSVPVKPVSPQRPLRWIPPPPPPPSSDASSAMKTNKVGRSYQTVVIPPMPPAGDKVSRTASPDVVTERTLEIRTSNREHPPAKSSPSVDTTSNSSSPIMASEYEIRKLAREEIVRYRRAERKLEAHKDPFAHGKMVEVQRVPVTQRLDRGQHVSADLAWQSSKSIKRKDSVLDAVDDQPGEETVVGGEISSAKATAGSEGRLEVNVSKRTGKVQQSQDRQHRNESQSHTFQSTTSDVRSRGTAAGPDGRKYDKPPAGGRDGAAVERGGRTAAHESIDARPSPPDEREYEYTRRIVTPADGRVPPPRKDNTHYETREYLRRAVVPEKSEAAQHEPKDRDASTRPYSSDASSRVHFSKKLDVSPTPPDSEASSSEFRYFAAQARTKDGQVGYRVRRQGLVQSETAAKPMDRPTRPPEQILSESPSREIHQHNTKVREREGYGPYVRSEKRSTSVDVEDGSTVHSASWSGSGYVRREERRGNR